MTSEVKMPQLGMNQDSAVIVAWLKSAGDQVTKGEPIFEVETDKATVEVEAAADGYLAGIRAGEGDDVPVGDVIAVLVASADEVADHADTAPTAAPAPEEGAGDATDGAAADTAPPVPSAPAVPQAAAAAPAAQPLMAPAPPVAAGGKVLASAKAKRLASERGIDLAALRAQGIAEPIHVADLAKGTSGGQSSLTARVDGAALAALLARSDGADRSMLLVAFAAGGWRAIFAVDDVEVALRGLDGTLTTHANPDRGGGVATGAAALSVVDLCDTRLAGYAPAGGGPTLSVASDGDAFVLTLAFAEGTLAMPHAVALLDTIAARVEDPIRQLL